MCLRSVCVCIYWLREIVSWVISCAYEWATVSSYLVESRISRDLSSVLWMSSVASRRPRPIPAVLVDAVSMLRVSDGRWGGFWLFIVKTRYPISEYVYIWSCVCVCVYITVNLCIFKEDSTKQDYHLRYHSVGHIGEFQFLWLFDVLLCIWEGSWGD